jgi:hypothetical protein
MAEAVRPLVLLVAALKVMSSTRLRGESVSCV